MKKILIYTTIFIILDQIIKIFISKFMNLHESINIIKNFFSITLVHNTGAAFSILTNNVPLLIGISLISLVLIYYYLLKDNKLIKIDYVIYCLLIGGITGNLIDRIIHGYVIDYLSFKIFNYYFPIFNLADIGIVISVVLIIFKGIKEEVCKK